MPQGPTILPQQDNQAPMARLAFNLPEPTKRSMFSLKYWRLAMRRLNALINMQSIAAAQAGPLIVSDSNCLLPVPASAVPTSGGGGNMRYVFDVPGFTAALYDATLDYEIYDVVYTNPDSNTRISWVAEIANGPHQPAGAQAPTWPEPGTVYWRALARFFFNSATPQQYRPGFDAALEDIFIDPATGDVMTVGSIHMMDMTDDQANVSYALRNNFAVMTTYLDPKRQHWFIDFNSGASHGCQFCVFEASGSECFVGGAANGANIPKVNGVTVGSLSGWMAKLNKDGTVDAGFVSNSTFSPPPTGAALDGSGGIVYITNTSTIKRLSTSSGTIDAGFALDASPPAPAMTATCITPDGSGNFWLGNGAGDEGVRKIDNTGATVGGFVSDGFQQGGGSPIISAIAILPGGTQIAVGGTFDHYNTHSTPTARTNFCVLDTSGGLQSPNPNISSSVFCIVALSNGKFMIGGDFTVIDGVSQFHLARLNSNGTLDTSWTTGANQAVYRIRENARGEFVICGAFTSVGGATRHYIARLDAAGNVLGI